MTYKGQREYERRVTRAWDSANPWDMGDFIADTCMTLDDREKRLLERAREGEHTWSADQLYELNVLCFEARGWSRCVMEDWR